MADEEQMKQKYMQLQLMQQQMEEVNKHLTMLAEQNAELEVSLEALQELEHTKVNNEFLAPIANGIFVKGELKDTQKLVVNVGSNVTVEKNVSEVVELLREQQIGLTANLQNAEAVMQQLNNQAMMLYQELQQQSKE